MSWPTWEIDAGGVASQQKGSPRAKQSARWQRVFVGEDGRNHPWRRESGSSRWWDRVGCRTASGPAGRERGGSRPISRVLSRTTIHLGRTSPCASSDLPGSPCGPQERARRLARFPIWSCSRWGLPCRRMLPPARCALTAPFHPYLPAEADIGGLLSVALSVGSRPPGVTWHLALWSPDFPPRRETQRLPGRLPLAVYAASCSAIRRLVVAARLSARAHTVPCGSGR